jgi:hypothetical protein
LPYKPIAEPEQGTTTAAGKARNRRWQLSQGCFVLLGQEYVVQSFLVSCKDNIHQSMSRSNVIKTAGSNAIQGYGGYNISEFNMQDRTWHNKRGNFSQQNRSGIKYAGQNPLNAPKSVPTKVQGQMISNRNRKNTDFDWREQTLPDPLPGQVAGGFSALAGASSDTSLLQWNMRHGFAQNDPNLTGMLNERNIAPSLGAHWRLQSDPYIHSDVLVPSVVNQNMIENPTINAFPMAAKRGPFRGKNDIMNMEEQRRPAGWNTSNSSVATFHTYTDPLFPVTMGAAGTIKATREPLNRPLLYSDLPSPPIPTVQN